MTPDIVIIGSGIGGATIAAGLAGSGASMVILERGERLAPSLRNLADQLHDPTADLVISALVLAAEHQARQVADLLASWPARPASRRPCG